MPEMNQRTSGASQGRWLDFLFPAFSILLLVSVVLASCAQTDRRTPLSPAERDASLQRIAADYSRDADLAKAQASLDKLGLANSTQLLVTLAEQGVNEGRPPAEIAPLARLIEALGAHSPRLIAYLAPTATPVPPSPTPIPPSPTPLPTATPLPPTATPTAVPPTVTPTSTPRPRVVAANSANLRGGPGVNYPLVGELPAGQEASIIGRTAGSDWWQVAVEGASQAWVAGTVVKVQGPIDTVPIAKDIPAPPPTSTPAPSPQPAATPTPSTAYVVKSLRVRPVGQDSQSCPGGEHNIFVQVVDPAGNPIDNVRVREIWTGTIQVTGAQGKGAGRAEFDLYRDGGGQLVVVDEGNNPISPQTRGMSSNLPDWDMFQAAGYCNCKPYPDVESCHAGWEARDFRYFPMSHYVYEVVFQRTW